METHFNTCMLLFLTHLKISGENKFSETNVFLHDNRNTFNFEENPIQPQILQLNEYSD